MLEADIRKEIEGSPFSGDADRIMNMARPAVRIRTFLVECGDLPPGASRMGGAPDLPPDMAWPHHNGRPMEFLAQIDFTAAAAAHALPDMPTTGWLALFCDFEGIYMHGSRGPGSWHVDYFEGDAKSLRRTAYPGTPAIEFNFCEVQFAREDCVPTLWDTLSISDADWDDCEDLNERINEADNYQPVHRLGGHPMLIQTFPDDYAGQEFLMQIDSDEEANFMWGDAGRLFFWIRARDLKARRFQATMCGDEFY